MKHKLLLPLISLACLCLGAVQVSADDVGKYDHLAMCDAPTGNMTEAMIFHREAACKEATALVDAGTFTKDGSCSGGILSTFSHDAEGNSCPDTIIDNVGEVVAIIGITIAGGEMAGLDLVGSGQALNEAAAAAGLTF